MASLDADTVTITQLLEGARTLEGTGERPRVEVTWEDDGGLQRALVEHRVVVGSAPRADVVVASSAVSRLHAELEPVAGGLRVRDLSSKNGTFVEEVRVWDAYAATGRRIRLGPVALQVSASASPGAVDLWPSSRFGPLVGRSAVMRELFHGISRIAASDATVLLEGETGTGKELVARAIHLESARRQGPYVVVDCAAVPESLIEAELFGHVRGAFTGADAPRRGAIEAASGGTIFIDEVGELSLRVQPKLLRFLQERTIRRIGEAVERRVDVRVVAATHRDLRTMVNEGSFREDLFFRLAVIPLRLPPLRERREDLPLLVQHFLPEGHDLSELSDDVKREIEARPWHGNVRELRNFVERIGVLGADQALAVERASQRSAEERFPPAALDDEFRVVRDRWVGHLERTYIAGLLERHGGNVSAVAQAAGLDRSYVHRLIRKHDLTDHRNEDREVDWS